MKNFTMKIRKTHSNKALLLGALAVTSAFALTPAAEAAPRNSSPTWDNQRYNQGRIDNRYDNRRDHDRFYNTRNNKRDDNRYDFKRDYDRNDYRYDRDKDSGTSTTKLIGAGLIGAILGAVLSR
jgi:hypothetical protein